MIPCSEANSYPDAPERFAKGCLGRYVNHYWKHKERVMDRFEIEFADNAHQALLAHLNTTDNIIISS